MYVSQTVGDARVVGGHTYASVILNDVITDRRQSRPLAHGTHSPNTATVWLQLANCSIISNSNSKNRGYFIAAPYTFTTRCCQQRRWNCTGCGNKMTPLQKLPYLQHGVTFLYKIFSDTSGESFLLTEQFCAILKSLHTINGGTFCFNALLRLCDFIK